MFAMTSASRGRVKDIRRLMTDARRSQDTKESKLCGALAAGFVSNSLTSCPAPRHGAEADLELDLDIPTATCGFIKVAGLGKSKSWAPCFRSPASVDSIESFEYPPRTV